MHLTNAVKQKTKIINKIHTIIIESAIKCARFNSEFTEFIKYIAWIAKYD